MENVNLLSRVSKMEWSPKFGRSCKIVIVMGFAGIVKAAVDFGFSFIQVQSRQ